MTKDIFMIAAGAAIGVAAIGLAFEVFRNVPVLEQARRGFGG